MDVKCHKEKLASFCRRCGNFFDTNPATSRHKPKLAVTFSKELQAVDGLDVSNDREEMHPPSLCRCCILKLERFKKSRNRNDRQLKFPGDKGKCCVFLTHDSYVKEGSCPICFFNLRQSPRKKGPMNLTTAPLQVEMPVRIQRELQLGVKRNLLLLDRSLPVQLKLWFGLVEIVLALVW